jgi:hypothetical protein
MLKGGWHFFLLERWLVGVRSLTRPVVVAA